MQTFRSLRHRNYRLYFFGQMLSLTGSWTQNTAMMWLAHEQTHQAKWPAFLVAAQIGPTLFFGPWGGSLADRLPKRRLIQITQWFFFTNALVLLLVHMLGALNVWVMLALMFVHGIIQSVDLPSRLAFVSDLVPRDDLINAVALNSLLFNVARAIGPALAGLLLSYTSASACFAFNAISYSAIIYALVSMHLPREVLEHHEHTIAGGFHALRQRPALMYLILVAGLVAVSGWPLLALLPKYVEENLQGSAENYSTLVSAVGIGALIAALTAARFGTETSSRLGDWCIRPACRRYPLHLGDCWVCTIRLWDDLIFCDWPIGGADGN
jgi:MFS family permease